MRSIRGLTKRDRKALAHYIRWVADHLELRDWEFDLEREPSEDDCWATVTPTYGKKHAAITVAANFRELAPYKQREIVVHELVHCHLAQVQSQVEDDLEEQLSKSTDAIFFAAFRRNVEYAVDGLSKALAEHFPLIAWPDAGS